MTTDAEAFDAACERAGGRRSGDPEGMTILVELADEVRRVLGAPMLTEAERERLYLRATAIVEAGLLAHSGWTGRLLRHRRAMIGGALVTLAAVGAMGFVVHDRRSHPRIMRARIAA
jgi:hypothetical protein